MSQEKQPVRNPNRQLEYSIPFSDSSGSRLKVTYSDLYNEKSERKEIITIEDVTAHVNFEGFDIDWFINVFKEIERRRNL